MGELDPQGPVLDLPQQAEQFVRNAWEGLTIKPDGYPNLLPTVETFRKLHLSAYPRGSIGAMPITNAVFCDLIHEGIYTTHDLESRLNSDSPEREEIQFTRSSAIDANAMTEEEMRQVLSGWQASWEGFDAYLEEIRTDK